jgi:hypothetical protein
MSTLAAFNVTSATSAVQQEMLSKFTTREIINKKPSISPEQWMVYYNVNN